ncbi:N-6 DNA methylase [Micromonospora sp. CA-111912]|uniref:N-6 DNA methylase n=1 Tax=Micromonospora sp. CA-111912 TaxID=3239955 RepID=UPI003D94F1E5
MKVNFAASTGVGTESYVINDEIKNSVDRIWDTFWSGGMSNPLEITEQIAHLLFIKRLDELHTREQERANRQGKPMEHSIFPEGCDDLRWSRFREADPAEMFEIVSKRVFPFLQTLRADLLAYARHARDARFTIPNPVALSRVVYLLDGIQLEDRELSSALYEYMLNKVTAAGNNGQFHTPRHIIQLMVEMTTPGPNDQICDPACGTAGFLVAAANYIRNRHADVMSDPAQRTHFNEDTFHGFDFDSTMLRIGSMNMMLNGVTNPGIRYSDSLADDYSNNPRQYSLILTNPPFAGSVDYETVSKDLQRIVKTKKSELLFLALSLRLLEPGGRAAVIVPEGVLFGSSKAHKELRRTLVENQKLDGVVKLPGAAFRPYSGVSTTILLFTKTNNGGTDNVWFYEITADGWSPNDKRDPLLPAEKLGPVTRVKLSKDDHSKNNLPDVLARWFNREGSERNRKRTDQSFIVKKQDIIDQDYDLTLQRYQRSPEQEQLRQGEGHRLGDLAEVFSGWVEAFDLDSADNQTGVPKEARVLQPSLLLSKLPPVETLPIRKATGEPKRRLRAGDIVGRDLAELRHWTVLPQSYDGLQAGRGIVVIRPKQKVLPAEYLAAFLSSQQAERQIPRYSVIPRIQMAGLAELRIPPCDGSISLISSAISKIDNAVEEIRLMQAAVRESQARVFEKCSSAERRRRLEKAAELGALTAHNLRKQRHPYQVFQDTYPYAIARAVRQMRHSTTVRESHESAIQCAESLILSLGIASLSVCAERGWHDLAEVAEWSRSVERGGVSLGHWVGVIRAVGNFARERRDDPAGLAEATAGQKGGNGLISDLSALVTMRNKIRHGGGPRTQAEIEKSLKDLEHLLLHALTGSAFLARTRWVYTTKLRWSSGDNLFKISGLAVMGDHPDFESIEFEAPRPLDDQRLYMISQAGEKFELAPFCVLDDCPSCLAPELYYPNRLAGSSALLKSLDRGHELESSPVFVALQTWMLHHRS